MTASPPSAVDRAPVLFPAPLRRRRDAAQRVVVTADGAVVHRRAGRDRVLLPAGPLLGAHLLSGGPDVGGLLLPQERGEWVLLRGARTSLALAVNGWTPGAPVYGSDRLEISGVRALLARLGHPDPRGFDLDRVDPDVLRSAPRPRLLDPRPRRLVPLAVRMAEGADGPLIALRLTLLGLLLLWVGDGIIGEVTQRQEVDHSTAVLTALAALVGAPAAWVLVSGRRPQSPRRPGIRRRAGVELTDAGTALLVTAADGTRSALPGPSLGGVATLDLVVADGQPPVRAALLTDAGIPMAVLPAGWWPVPAGAALPEVLVASGLHVVRHRVPRGATAPPSRALSYDDHSIGYLTLVLTMFMSIIIFVSDAVAAGVVLSMSAAAGIRLLVLDRRAGRPS